MSLVREGWCDAHVLWTLHKLDRFPDLCYSQLKSYFSSFYAHLKSQMQQNYCSIILWSMTILFFMIVSPHLFSIHSWWACVHHNLRFLFFNPREWNPLWSDAVFTLRRISAELAKSDHLNHRRLPVSSNQCVTSFNNTKTYSEYLLLLFSCIIFYLTFIWPVKQKYIKELIWHQQPCHGPSHWAHSGLFLHCDV